MARISPKEAAKNFRDAHMLSLRELQHVSSGHHARSQLESSERVVEKKWPKSNRNLLCLHSKIDPKRSRRQVLALSLALSRSVCTALPTLEHVGARCENLYQRWHDSSLSAAQGGSHRRSKNARDKCHAFDTVDGFDVRVGVARFPVADNSRC